MSEKKELTEDEITRLGKAWTSILQMYKSKVEIDTLECGAGIGIFNMLSIPHKGANCKYIYAIRDEVGPWKTILNTVTNGAKVRKLYDPDKHYLMAVAVPVNDDIGSVVTSVKLFQNETGDEIETG